MALRAVPDHPKFANLKVVLAQPKGATMGWLEAVWHFTGRFTPQGNIGKYTDESIEAWVEWNGEPGALIESLVRTGWLDRDETHRLLVHDWPEHADKATKNSLSRAKLAFCTPTVRTPSVHHTYKNPESGNISRLPVPEPVPEPEPEPEPVPAVKPDSVDARIISETVGIFGMREQADMMRLVSSYSATSGKPMEQILEHMEKRWGEYQNEAPNLEWTYGSSYKFFMSGNWDKPDSWPRKQKSRNKAIEEWEPSYDGERAS